MKFPITLISLLALSSFSMAQETKAPETLEEKISYTIGVQIGQQLNQDDLAIVPDHFLAGVLDSLEEKELKLTEEEQQNTMIALQERLQAKREEMAAAKNVENAKFFEDNGKKDGVVTTDSGLQYKVLEEGKGEKPQLNDTITAHYHGTLLDGTVFDSSVDRGSPASFPVNRVIAGWTEALQLMPVGSKWRLFVPSDLAYGERGTQGGPIGPNTPLIFDVELLSID